MIGNAADLAAWAANPSAAPLVASIMTMDDCCRSAAARDRFMCRLATVDNFRQLGGMGDPPKVSQHDEFTIQRRAVAGGDAQEELKATHAQSR